MPLSAVLLPVLLMPMAAVVVPVAPHVPVAVSLDDMVAARRVPVQPRAVVIHPGAHAARGDGQQRERKHRRREYLLHLQILQKCVGPSIGASTYHRPSAGGSPLECG